MLALRGENLLQPKQTVQDWLSGRYDGNGNASLVYGFPAFGPPLVPGRHLEVVMAHQTDSPRKHREHGGNHGEGLFHRF